MIKTVKKLTSLVIIVLLVQSTLYAPNMGLVNQNGNDCFFSASFQCLSQIKPLIDFLENNLEVRTPIGPIIGGQPTRPGIIQARFYEFVGNMKRHSRLTQDFRAFITSRAATDDFYLSQMATEQQDAHEFLSLLLQYLIGQTPYHANITEQLQAIMATTILAATNRTAIITRIMGILNTDMQKIVSLKEHLRYVIQTQPSNAMLLSSIPLEGNDAAWGICDARIKKLQELYRIFDIGLESTLTCPSCGPVYASRQPVIERALQVSIPPEKTPVSLDDCFDDYEKPQVLSDDNKWRCSNCNTRVNAIKKFTLESAPQILIVSLKRFRTVIENKEVVIKKITTPVKFPLTLSRRIKDTTLNFNLFGFVCQSGSMRGGHYWAYVTDKMGDDKKVAYNKWQRYNDSDVKDTEGAGSMDDFVKNKLRHDGIDNSVRGWPNATPYIFFYELDKSSETKQAEMVDDSKKLTASASTSPSVPKIDKIDLKPLEDLKGFFKKFASMKTAIERCKQLLKQIEDFERKAFRIFAYTDREYSRNKGHFIAELKKSDFVSFTLENKITIEKEQATLAAIGRDCFQELVKVVPFIKAPQFKLDIPSTTSIYVSDTNNALLAYGFASSGIERYNKFLITQHRLLSLLTGFAYIYIKTTLLSTIDTLSLENAKGEIKTLHLYTQQLTPLKDDLEKLLSALNVELPVFNIDRIRILVDQAKGLIPPSAQLQSSLDTLRQKLQELRSVLSKIK